MSQITKGVSVAEWFKALLFLEEMNENQKIPGSPFLWKMYQKTKYQVSWTSDGSDAEPSIKEFYEDDLIAGDPASLRV